MSNEDYCSCTKKPPGAGNNIGCGASYPCCYVYGGGSTCDCSTTEEGTCVAVINQVAGERFDSCPPP